MIPKRPSVPAFKQGEEVVLEAGTYPGTRGTFLQLRPDANWAEIRELDGRIRSHPLAWLGRWTGSYSGAPLEFADPT